MRLKHILCSWVHFLLCYHTSWASDNVLEHVKSILKFVDYISITLKDVEAAIKMAKMTLFNIYWIYMMKRLLKMPLVKQFVQNNGATSLY